MSQLRPLAEEFESLGVSVVVVTFESPARATQYAHETQLPWPLVIDESCELYRAYDMQRGSWWKVLGPSSWWVYIRLLLRGRRLRGPKADVRQLGGDVLIDDTGTVRLQHVTSTPANRPPVESLLDLVRESKGTG